MKQITSKEAKQIRKSLGLTQKEMAKQKIGVVWQSISKYENGEPIPEPIKNLYRLIQKFEVE